ncbi:VWA domain-containing protein, partial [Streptomyces sp. NPDC127049]|uniref:VWA domain-containing protein n=1 Tax=Streptomyces sp. NPDC127049 TaxID=3347118 RepID=UPI003646C7F9
GEDTAVEAESEAGTDAPEAAAEAQPEAVADAAASEPAATATATADAESEPTAGADDDETAQVEPAAAADVPAQAEPVAALADEAAPEAEGVTPSEAAGRKSALSLARVKGVAPQLAEAYKAAGGVLRKEGLEGARAQVYLVVDRSGSMRGYFKDGSVQRLAEQAVALAAHLDEEATVTTVFFSTDIDGVVDLTPADLTPTRVEEINAGLGRLGRTNYHRAVEEVLAHHEKADPARPALVIFQTDGAPESRTAATQALAEAAGRPVHWRFTAWGEEDGKAFDYLRKLTADRTATHFAGPAPVETPHAEFYRGVVTGLSL